MGNANCGPTKAQLEYNQKMQSYQRKVEKTELLIQKIGVPQLSTKVHCKESELNLRDHSSDSNKETQCTVEFDLDTMKIHGANCIEFYNNLLEYRNVKVMSETNFDAFINDGRFWQCLNTHYTCCVFPPNMEALGIIRRVLEIWHLTLITIYRFYYHGHANLQKPNPKNIVMEKRMEPKLESKVDAPTLIPIQMSGNLPLPLQPERVSAEQKAESIL